MKLTNREKVILPAALLVILIAVFINYVYLPINHEIKNLSLQSLELTTQIQDAVVQEEEITKLKERLATAEQDFEQEHGDILQVWDQPELLAYIENTVDPLCEKTSVDFFDVVSVQTVQAGDINLVIRSNYINLEIIFKKFEEADYYNTITSFNIIQIRQNSLEPSASPYELEVSFNIRFYARNLKTGYPKDYNFVDGAYGKTNLFE